MNKKIPITLFVDSPEIANDIYLLAKQAGITAIEPNSELNKASNITSTSAHKIMLMKAEKLEASHNKPKESKQTEENVKNEFLELIKTRNGV